MIENTLNALLATFAAAIMMFVMGLYISRYFNSPSLLRLIATMSAAGIVLISVYLKQQSSWFVGHSFAGFAISAYSLLLGLRLLELVFAYQWSYVRQMPLKLVLLYFLAFPRMPTSEDKFSELSNQYTNRESIKSMLHGIFQVVLCQLLVYFAPSAWFTLPSTSFPLFVRFARNGLLSFLLYLGIGAATDFGFGLYSYLTKIPMNRAFPLFPFTSTSLRDFWSYRWNNLIKSSLHLMSFTVIPNFVQPIVSIPNSVKGLLAFAISGVIHEYALRFISNTWSGKNMLFFLLHALFMLFELKMKIPTRAHSLHGKLLGWVWTLTVFITTSSLFFDPMIERGVFANMKSNFNQLILLAGLPKSEL